MKPTASVRHADLYRADLMDFLSDYEGRPFDLTITSPPYALGVEYDGVDDLAEYDDWIDWCETWLAAIRERTSDRGRLCLNIPLDTAKSGNRPVYKDVLIAVEAAGWSYRTTIVWNEGTVSGTGYGSWARPTAPNVVSPCEMIVVASNGEWRRSPEGKTWDLSGEQFKRWRLATWDIPNHGVRGHPAPFPEELPFRLIKLFGFTEDLVLDPFGGSGTVSRAANRLGRASIYVDQSEKYLELAIKRCDVEEGAPFAGPKEEPKLGIRVVGGLRDSEGRTWVNYGLEDALEAASSS